MIFQIEFLLDAGDLGTVSALAVGAVEESETGEHIRVEIKKVTAYFPQANGIAGAGQDVTHMVQPWMRTTLEEKMEAQYEHARFNCVKPEDYWRDER